MKKSFIYIVSALCLLVSCQREAPVQDGLREIRFTASVEGVTKATATAFEEGDQIGLTIGAPVSVDNVTLTPDGMELVPENTLYWPVDMKPDQAAQFVAYYPFVFSTYSQGTFDASKTWIAGTESRQFDSGIGPLQDYMSAVTVASPSDGSVNLRFRHLMSRFNLTIVDRLKTDYFDEGNHYAVEIGQVQPWFEINFADQYAAAKADGGQLYPLYPAGLGKNTFSLILPPQTVAPEINITLASGKTMTYKSTTPIPFEAGQRISATLLLFDNQITFNYQIEDWEDDYTDVSFIDITDTPPSDEIWYTSVDGKVVEPNEEAVFGDNVTLVSNTYEDGKGILKFSGAVTTVGYNAFYVPNRYEIPGRLKSVNLPESCLSIGNTAFQYQESLEEIRLPLSLQFLEWGALYGCRALANIDLPEGLIGIGGYAFCYCALLEEVTIPESVEYVDGGAFCSCTGLTQFHGKFADAAGRALINENYLFAIAPAGLTSYTVPAGIRTIASGVFSGFNNLTEIILPDGLQSIQLQAFSHCAGLTEMVIPESVTYLGSGVFRGCNQITSINLPSGITSIPGELFSGCQSLQSIFIPEGVTGIQNYAFTSCSSLTTVTIPSLVETIGNFAFEDCTGLESIFIEAVNPPAGGNGMFDNTNNCPIYVPAESVDAYKEAEYWSNYADRIQAME